MRAPIGIRIRNARKQLSISQAGLARLVGISPSYLNLIEANKREVGGALLNKIAQALKIDPTALTGDLEQRLIDGIEEIMADPLLSVVRLNPAQTRNLVAEFPDAGRALVRIYRGYGDATASADAYANRLRADPLLAQLLHQVLSQVTAVRSAAEILDEVPDLTLDERQRFLSSIGREALALSDVAQTLIAQFDRAVGQHRSTTPVMELDDLIIAEANHFPALETCADDLRAEVEQVGKFGEAGLAEVLGKKFGVSIERGEWREPDDATVPGQYWFDAKGRTMWLRGSTNAATRQFQLARLYAELAAPDILMRQISDRRLTSEAARRLGYRAMASYLAGAIIFPYDRFLEDAAGFRYDVDFLGQAYGGSFEQVAHRLVTLRRKGSEAIPFGFLRSDPAGRLTKQFPLPGLLLPNTGHACPLWAIYAAFRSAGQVVRQVVSFADGSRYLFVAKTVAKRLTTFHDQPFHSSVMLACDILNAGDIVYGEGLDLSETDADVKVGPACRLCVRRDCAYRQEEALDPTGQRAGVHQPLVPRRFALGAHD